MIKNRETNIIAGLDIGTSKVVAIVGQVQPDSGLEIIGMGQHISCLLYTSDAADE